MTEVDLLRAPLTPREDAPRSPAPLVLGDPAAPALTLREDALEGHVILETANPVIYVGRMGVHAVLRWTELLLGENRDDAPELWTTATIGKECGVSRRTAYNWIERDGFPRPFAEPVGGVPVWEADAIRAWLLTDRPRAGRPPSAP